MNIRDFSENDLPAILDIYEKSKLDELLYESVQFQLLPLEKDEKRLRELLESEIYVYEMVGVVAYCALFGSEIRALFVHPSERGKGIGKILLNYLLSKIDGSAILYVAKTNSPAKRLYEKYGFVVVEEFETTYNNISVLANKMTRI